MTNMGPWDFAVIAIIAVCVAAVQIVKYWKGRDD